MSNIFLPSTPNVYFKAPYERAYHLLGADRREKRKFLCVTNNWERLLFKYKVCDEEHLKSYILDSYFYMSDRSQLNDPFDVKSRIDFSGGGINRKNYLDHLAAQFPMTQSKRREVEKRLNSPQKIESLIRLNLQNEINGTGVHSFATTPKNLLMWAHYADSHRGVCLIFEVCADIDTFVAALPVIYSDSYPVIKYHTGIGQELIKKSFLTKSSEWSYESERRIFDRGAARKFLAFNSTALLGIVLGANISEANKSMLYSLLDKRRSKGLPDMKVYQAHCSDSEYKLKIWRA